MLIAAFALLAAAQVDNPDLDCILDRLPAASRIAVAEEATGPERASRPGTDALVAATEACRRQLRWEPGEAASFQVLAHAFVLGDHSRERLRRAGVDPQLILSWFDAQTLAARTDLQISEALMERLVVHLQSAGISDERIESQIETIGGFYASLVLIERLSSGLPVD
jgi:hypothetical protein